MISRYASAPVIGGGIGYGTSRYVHVIFNAIVRGDIQYDEQRMSTAQRLDTIAATRYGDDRLWWIIAAASGIGWALQVPAGTIVRVPIDPTQVLKLVG